MTLDDIEKSIYGGKKSIDEALNSINHYLSNKKQMMDPQKYIDIQTALKLVNGQYSAISTQFINHISINSRYKSYIKDSIPETRDFGLTLRVCLTGTLTTAGRFQQVGHSWTNCCMVDLAVVN